jgi:hypothetical protein
MRAARKLSDLCCIVATTGLFIAGQAYAGVSCHKINAKGVGQDLGGGNTEAYIIGGGLLHERRKRTLRSLAAHRQSSRLTGRWSLRPIRRP